MQQTEQKDQEILLPKTLDSWIKTNVIKPDKSYVGERNHEGKLLSPKEQLEAAREQFRYIVEGYMEDGLSEQDIIKKLEAINEAPQEEDYNQ